MSAPRHTIAKIDKRWVLEIHDEQCSVMQVFRSASDARLAVDRMMEFFKTMSSQPPGEAA